MTILDEIVLYKKDLLKQGYYEEKLKTLDDVDISHKTTFKAQIDESNRLAVIAEIWASSGTTPSHTLLNRMVWLSA